MAGAAKICCQNAVTVHDRRFLKTDKTKGEQHSCSVILIPYVDYYVDSGTVSFYAWNLKIILAATSPEIEESVYLPSYFAFVMFLPSSTSLHCL